VVEPGEGYFHQRKRGEKFQFPGGEKPEESEEKVCDLFSRERKKKKWGFYLFTDGEGGGGKEK